MIDTVLINTSLKENFSFGWQAGLKMPDFKFYNATPPEEWAGITTNGKWIVEDGIAIRKKEGSSVACIDYWDGEKFCYPHIAINDKGLLNESQGPQLDANSVTLFRNRDRICRDEFRKIAHLIKQREFTYRGFVTLEVTLSPDGVWYNGIQFGLVEDYLFLLSKLYGIDLIDVDTPDWNAPTEYNFVCSLRMWTYEHDRKFQVIAIRTPDFIDGMNIESIENFIIVTSGGKRIYDCWKKLYESIPENLPSIGVCCRTDGDDFPKRIYHTLKQEKIICGK